MQELFLHEGADYGFVALGEDETDEGVGVPGYSGDE